MKRFFAGLLLLLLVASQPAFSAIAIDNTSSGSINGGTSLNVSHTTGNGSDLFMLVGISMWNDDYETVTSVTYSGQNLVYVGARAQDDDSRVEIWKLVNPPVTTSDVRITFNESVQRGAGAGVMTFTGVDQASPHDVFQSNTGDSGLATLTVTSETNDLAFAVAAAEQQDSAMSISLGDQRWNFKANGNNKLAGAGATLAGATSTNFRWNLGDSDDWVVAGLSINPSSGGGGPLPSPILEYRFDECSLASGVTDSAGVYDGTANGSTDSTAAEFQINRSLNLSATGTSDYVTLDSDAVNGLNDFSISTWIKTGTSKSQQEIFQALGSSQNDDEIEIYLENSTVVRMNVADRGSTVSAGKTLTDDAWHHLVVTRSGSSMCLYVDGSLANCHTNGGGSQISINNSSSVIIGQEQDSFAGSFDSTQAFEGYIDEFKIYSQVLSSTHVDEIYQNESNGDNADGSSRSAVNCTSFQWEGGSVDVTVGSTETINFDQTYTSPVVFLVSMFDNPDPTHVRLVSVSSNSAQIVAVEPPDEDGSGTETVNFIVAEAGEYELSDGTKIEVGTQDVSDVQRHSSVGGSQGWATVNFTQSFSSAPVLITTLMSSNNDSGSFNSPWLSAAARNVTSSGFQAALERAEVSSGNVTQSESYGYLAVESGSLPDFINTNSGQVVVAEAIRSGDTISHVCEAVNLTQTFATEPDFVAAMNRRDGNNGGWARGCGATTTSVSVAIDEDTFRDSERSHTNEDVGIVVFESAPVVTLPAAFAEWRFDELIWTGALAEIKDNVGSFDGSVIDTGTGNVTNIPDGKLCRAGQIGDNNSDGDQYAIDTTLDIDDDIGDQGSISFWYRSATTWGSNSERKVLLSASSTGSDDKYFYITMETDGRLQFGLEDISDADFRYSSSTQFSFASTEWVHISVTWDMPNSVMQMYVNGALEINGSFGSTLSIGELLSIYLGDNRSDYIAGEGGRSADGDFDELLLFDEVISQTDVTTIYTNQDSGLNYDGSARQCPSSPIAEWRFDEASWGTVEDNIGSNDGSASGDANTTSPGQICRAGEFDGNGDYVSGLDLSQLQTTASLSFWIKTSQTGSNSPWTAPGVTGVEQSGGTDDIFWGWLDSSGRIGLTVGDDYNNTKSNTAINDGDWHHVVLTRNSTDGAYQIFIDGSLDKSGTGGIGDIGNSFDLLGKIKSSSDELEGLLDEVLIFDEALSLSQVTAIHTNQLAGLNWDGSTRPDCVVGPDHYSISHGANGVTCLSEQITITAHDASHNPIDAAQSTITITTDSGLGDWLSIVSGGGSLANGTANDGEATYTFASGSSSVTLEFSHTTTGTFGFNVTDGSVTETTGNAIAADDPNMIISNAVLKFVDSSGNPLNIGTQISGKDSSNVYLRAIEADVGSPTSCSSSFSGSQSIGFAASCQNPSTCVSGQRFFVNGSSINVLDSGSPLSYTGVNITFDANSVSTQPLALNYEDAGLMRLNVNLADPAMNGQSNDFVVRPFAFGFPSITAGAVSNNAGDETGGDGFTSAGSDFDVAINAYRYQSADDSNNDNIPDAGVDVTNNGVTPNFTGTVTLSTDSYTPAAGVQGNLTGTTTPLLDTYASRSGADVTATLQYDEVGSVSIIAQLDDYLADSAADIRGVVTKIGRFYPDYIALSDVNVTSSCSSFIYMQQPFAEVAYRLEARAANDDVTENYDIALYDTEEVKFAAEDSDNGTDLSSRLTTSSALSGWTAGVVNRTSSGDGVIADLIFTRNGGAAGFEDGPYEQLQLGIYLDQTTGLGDGNNFDSVTLNFDPATAGSCGGSCTGAEIGSTFDARYGRLYTQSAHGPENEALPVPFSVQYWDGNGFVTAINDSCSQVPLTNITFDGNSIDTAGNRIVTVGAGTSTGTLGINGVNAQPASGDFTLEFSAPGEGNTGYFNLGISNVPNWLRYDWDQNGSADDANMPDALITFGRARGNDRMIFWQERYQ
jgi:hypothetical protein